MQEPSVPEIITFYPREKTASYLLSQISGCLRDEIIKPLKKTELVEIKGILGEGGKIPIRMKLLDEKQKEEIGNKYAYEIYSEAEIILLEAPDLNGYFAIDDNCSSLVKRNVPEKWRLPSTDISLDLSNFFQGN